MLAGLHSTLSAIDSPTLFVHCDYDSQAGVPCTPRCSGKEISFDLSLTSISHGDLGVMEPITEQIVRLLRDRYSYRIFLHIGFHVDPTRGDAILTLPLGSTYES